MSPGLGREMSESGRPGGDFYRQRFPGLLPKREAGPRHWLTSSSSVRSRLPIFKKSSPTSPLPSLPQPHGLGGEVPPGGPCTTARLGPHSEKSPRLPLHNQGPFITGAANIWRRSRFRPLVKLGFLSSSREPAGRFLVGTKGTPQLSPGHLAPVPELTLVFHPVLFLSLGGGKKKKS